MLSSRVPSHLLYSPASRISTLQLAWQNREGRREYGGTESGSGNNSTMMTFDTSKVIIVLLFGQLHDERRFHVG
jgi:hypothetical protein